MKKLKPMGAENVRKFAQPDQISQAQGNLRTCMRAVVTDVRYRLIFYLDVGHARQDEESLVGFAVLLMRPERISSDRRNILSSSILKLMLSPFL